MKELLRRLSEAYGPSGHEDKVREIIRGELDGAVDEIREDALGNLIAVKKVKRGTPKARIMVAAHMDEIGVIVTYIDEKGFLRFSNVGGISPFTLIGERVIFSNGVIGNFWHEPLEDMSELKLEKMYIDIGAGDRKKAMEMVRVGDVAGFHRSLEWVGERGIGKAMDDRAGCAVVVEAAKRAEELPNEVYFVFTSQEEVGLRGSRTSAYGLDPDIGIAVDVTATGDTPEAKAMAVKLGGGTAIKVRDASVISHPRVRESLIEIAEARGIPYQLEVLERGGTDAGGIHLTREGIPSGAVSVPCRYIHSPSEMIDYADMINSVDLLVGFLENAQTAFK